MKTQLRITIAVLLISTAARAHEAAFSHEHHGDRIVRLADWSDAGSYRGGSDAL